MDHLDQMLEMLTEAPDVARPLDELSRRRHIDDILARAAKPAETALAVPRRPKRWWAILVAATLLLIGFAVGLLAEKRAHVPSVRPGVGADSSAAVANVVLCGPGAIQLGMAIVPNQELHSGVDEMVLRIGRFSTAVLSPHTRLAFRQTMNDDIHLDLITGSVTVEILPLPSRPRFLVETDRATISVTGTVFKVQTGEAKTRLMVLRGSVDVIEQGNKIQSTVAGQGAESPLWENRALSSSSMEAIWEGVRRMDLLTARGVPIKVESTPEGAAVSIDGIRVGRTPLLATIRAGHRKLIVQKSGYQSVTEYLDGMVGERQERTFVLSRQKPDPRSLSAIVTERRDSEAPRVSTATSAQALLTLAQEARVARNWSDAADHYQALINRYPQSGQAHAALVSLGKLEIGKLNRPKRALAHFDQYLKKGGALSQEALFAKAQALSKLNRTAEERATLLRFLNEYPGAIAADSARMRLRELEPN